MADVTKIAANGIEYNIKDATARTNISTLQGDVSGLQENNLFTQWYASISPNASKNITLASSTRGFIVITGADTNSNGRDKEILIYNVASNGNIQLVRVRGESLASKLSFATSTNTLTIQNSLSTYVYAMMFSR